MKNSVWLLLLTCYTVTAGNTSLREVRNLYKQASTNESSCKQLLAALSRYTEHTDPVMTGYKASATMIMANHAWNPMSKLAYFTEGKNLLEKCILYSPDNIELRFLRLSIQQHAPSFLGYNSHIAQDKSFLLQSLPTMKDKQLQQIIVLYFSESGNLSNAEKQQLNL